MTYDNQLRIGKLFIILLLAAIPTVMASPGACDDTIDNDEDGDIDTDDTGCLDSSDASEIAYGYQIEAETGIDDTCMATLVTDGYGATCVSDHTGSLSWLIAYSAPTNDLAACLTTYSSDYYGITFDVSTDYTYIALADCVYQHYTQYATAVSDAYTAASTDTVEFIDEACLTGFYSDYESNCPEPVECDDTTPCDEGYTCVDTECEQTVCNDADDNDGDGDRDAYGACYAPLISKARAAPSADANTANVKIWRTCSGMGYADEASCRSACVNDEGGTFADADAGCSDLNDEDEYTSSEETECNDGDDNDDDYATDGIDVYGACRSGMYYGAAAQPQTWTATKANTAFNVANINTINCVELEAEDANDCEDKCVDQGTRYSYVDPDSDCTSWDDSNEGCDTNSDCGSDEECQDGECVTVGCTSTDECVEDADCIQYTCKSDCTCRTDCTSDLHCNSGFICDGNTCELASDCNDGVDNDEDGRTDGSDDCCGDDWVMESGCGEIADREDELPDGGGNGAELAPEEEPSFIERMWRFIVSLPRRQEPGRQEAPAFFGAPGTSKCTAYWCAKDDAAGLARSKRLSGYF